jgi:hypothetical protein
LHVSSTPLEKNDDSTATKSLLFVQNHSSSTAKTNNFVIMIHAKFLLAAMANVALMAALGTVDAAAVRRGNGNLLNVHDLNNMDKDALHLNAVKVDKRLVHRMLEDQGQQQEGGEGEDQAGEENANEGQDNENAENEDQQQQEEGGQEAEAEAEAEDQAEQEAEPQEEEAAEEEEQQVLQLSFLKCGAFTVDPNVVDVDAMVEAGEIDENQAAEMKAMYVTEVTNYLNTQESIVFFTVGYGQNDEERELYMTTLENWIRASMGYEDICHQLDEGDVETIFSTVTDETFAELYSGHAWYSGFNCLDNGTGFGTQLFLDETCNTYAPTMSNYYPFPKGSENLGAGNQQEEEQAGEEEQENANVDYTYRVASDLTPYMIQNADYFLQNVHYCEEVQGQEQEGQGNEENQQMAQQAREFCDNLFGVSVDVVTCAAYGEDEAREQEQQECNCEEEAADEQAEAGDENAEGEVDQGGENQENAQENEGQEENEGARRKKRRRNQECNCAQQNNNGYQINYDAIGDVEASCSTVRNLLNIDPNNFNGLNAEYVVSMWSNAKDGHQNESGSGIKTGWIVAIVIAAVVAMCGLLYCACAGRKMKSAAGRGDKSEPLVSSSNKPPRKKKESIEIYFQGSKRDATV